MNLKKAVKYLNENYKYNIITDYHEKCVKLWDDWWRGYNKEFHHRTEKVDGRVVQYELYSIQMAKKLAEEFPSVILNENPELIVEHIDTANFLKSEIERTNLWANKNVELEKANYSGTSATVIQLSNLDIDEAGNILVSPDSTYDITYVDASCIYPLRVKNGKIIDVAFLSETLHDGKKTIYAEVHKLEEDGYNIYNHYLLDDKYNRVRELDELPDGLLKHYTTGSNIPLFSITKLNIVNNIVNNGMGVSIYHGAIDILKALDIIFNNFVLDFELGGKKVFMDKSMTSKDDDGRVITPFEARHKLFVTFGDDISGDSELKSLMQEYNPDLRVEDNSKAIQKILDLLSFRCGLGTKHYQFNSGTIVTATQYQGDKQDLIQNANKHSLVVKQAIKDTLRAILWFENEIRGNKKVQADVIIDVKLDDSYILDKEAQKELDRKDREADRLDVAAGLMGREEYRKKWYKEDEKFVS